LTERPKIIEIWFTVVPLKGWVCKLTRSDIEDNLCRAPLPGLTNFQTMIRHSLDFEIREFRNSGNPKTNHGVDKGILDFEYFNMGWDLSVDLILKKEFPEPFHHEVFHRISGQADVRLMLMGNFWVSDQEMG
jgi:hypothetical protein